MNPRPGLAAVLSCVLAAGAARGQEQEEERGRAHFHHVHLNVTDVETSLRFYARVFGAVPVKYRGAADALFAERSWILLDRVDAPPPAALTSGIWHIGWGGVDVKNEYEWWKGRGVTIHTPLSPLPGPDNYYFYISGPDRELIEINTMGHHRFGHVHLFAADVNATTRWYAEHLGLRPRRPGVVPRPEGDMSTFQSIWINSFQCDNVNLIVFGKPDHDPPPPWWPDPPLRALAPTKGRAIDHLAFSYRDIGPVYERMKRSGARVVEPIASRGPLNLKSFFVLAPDDVLVEVVEAIPIPEGEGEGLNGHALEPARPPGYNQSVRTGRFPASSRTEAKRKGEAPMPRLLMLSLLAALAVPALAVADDKSAGSEQRVFELRTYYTNPGKLNDLHKRFRDHTIRIFQKHGIQVVGFWTPQDEKDGKVDKLIYLIAFPSREAAKKSWDAFKVDPEWKQVYAESHKDGVLVGKVDSVFLDPTDYSPLK